MQRWQTRFKHEGCEGLFDRRRGVPSPKRVPLATVERVLQLYQEQYFDFNGLHFHEKLVAEHEIKLSYMGVKLALQGACSASITFSLQRQLEFSFVPVPLLS